MANNSELLGLYSALRRNLSLEATSSLKEVGFSLRQFLILRNLGLQGAMTMTALADACMTDAATVSRSVCQLIKAQCVRKLRCPSDGRVWRAELTPKGEKLKPELERIHHALANHCFATLSAKEKAALADILQKVIASLEGKRRVDAAGEAV
jgi:DNA-binding MarR family transcriptional regulator